MRIIIDFLVILFLTWFPLSGSAASAVGKYTDWAVFASENPKECWAATAPKSGSYKRNMGGERLLMVFFRPKANVEGQPAITIGYKPKAGSKLHVRVGQNNFNLSTKGEWSWPSDAKNDDRLVRALMRGTEAEVTVHNGTKVTDWYKFSLIGFTEAYAEAKASCR